MFRYSKRHTSIKLTLVVALSGYTAVPARAVMTSLAGTAAYAAMTTAKSFAIGKALGYGVQSVCNKVYNSQKPTVSLETIHQERFVTVIIPPDHDMVGFVFSQKNGHNYFLYTEDLRIGVTQHRQSEYGLTLYIPEELCGKTVRIDLAKLEMVEKLIARCYGADNPVKRQEMISFLQKREEDIIAVLVALDQNKFYIANKLVLEEAQKEPIKLYFVSISQIIKACLTMLENINTNLSNEAKNKIIRDRDIKIMRSVCKVILTEKNTDGARVTTISGPDKTKIAIVGTEASFVVKEYAQKIEQFNKDNNNALGISGAVGVLTAIAAVYGIHYINPLFTKFLQLTNPGTALLNAYNNCTSIANKTVGSAVTYAGTRLSLPRQIATNTASFGLGNHTLNFLTTLIGIQLSWWTIYQQNKANMLFFDPKSTFMNRAKGFGLGMVHSLGSLFSSSWLSTLINPNMRSASWPLNIHSFVSLFHRPLPY